MASEPVSALLLGAMQLVKGQECVHRSRAESFQVEGHEFEAELLEDGRDLGGHHGVQSAGQFVAVDLNAYDLAVMADPELAKSERANRVLATLDHIQRVASDRAAVLDTRGQASGGGLVPQAQASATRCKKFLYSLSLSPDPAQGKLTPNDPPFAGVAFGNGYDPSLADVKGRFWYVQLKKRF